ncbi:uncharacterized protein LOC141620901 [Silene latifolia]|uniref:uncharacterized protein LOC141620901 n=1 Tax=Silene latifolia TaxID=37657 RepID=UPI003D76E29E
MSFIYIIIAIIVLHGPSLVHSATISTEVDVLRALKEGIDPNSIPDNAFLSTWDFSLDPCESTGAHFLGVLCNIPEDNSSSQITQLELDGVGYDGFLTVNLGNLTELTIINLSKNKFRGPIPESITKLNKLTSLTLSDNFFTGSLPTGIRRLKRLEELDISRNKLTGLIPTWITNFRSLHSLKMANNGFSGRIPDIAGLWQLNTLDLSGNQLFGTLPQLPISLRTVSLSHNVLSGSIHSLWTLKNLKMLDLSDNRFSGRIRGIVSLPEIVSLNLSVNWFTEIQVPRFAGESTELEILDVQENRLQGHLPANLPTMQKLTAIYLSHNQLSGPIPRSFGVRLGAPWRHVFLDNNFLVGNVPVEFTTSKLKVTGSLAHNCLKCPRNVTMCDGGQRPASECAGQSVTR